MIHINIREIARLCSVSVATVSRTINTPELVQAETRERVLRTMQSENYSPVRRSTPAASGAASHMLLFLFDAEDYSFYEPAFSGFETVVHPRGYTVLFCPVSAVPQRRRFQMEMLSRQKPAGAIWALRDFHPDDAASFSGKRIPLVLARKYDRVTTGYPHCYVDFTVGSFRMTQHLLSLGRRQIALLVEKASFQFVASFCRGWKRAYFENDLSFDERWIVHTPNTVKGGYEKARELLAQPDAPDAFFCASNEMAYGALRAARDLAIPVPQQLAITGFTDSPVATLSEPELTTISQPIEQLSAVAARMLLDLVEAPPDAVLQPQEIVLQPELCIRTSCGSRC